MTPDLDLAAVGNCVVASLIDRRARHAWFCWPRFDGDPVFCSLLDGDSPDAFNNARVALPSRKA